MVCLAGGITMSIFKSSEPKDLQQRHILNFVSSAIFKLYHSLFAEDLTTLEELALHNTHNFKDMVSIIVT